MPRRRVRTLPLGGNQERIDELEYFLEGLGGFLFGPEGEDYRRLGAWLPRTRNLSALIDAARGDGARDVGEDLQLLYDELAGEAVEPATPAARGGRLLFRYRLYRELVAHPERRLDRVDPAARYEVAMRLARGTDALRPLLARVNALAWLRTVGLPDLEEELTRGEPARLSLPAEDPAADAAALERALEREALGAGARVWLGALHAELAADYRRQLVHLVAATRPQA